MSPCFSARWGIVLPKSGGQKKGFKDSIICTNDDVKGRKGARSDRMVRRQRMNVPMHRWRPKFRFLELEKMNQEEEERHH
jgi:hypothetical protein